MAWTIKIHFDEDQADVGSINAIWTDAELTGDEVLDAALKQFIHHRRIKTSSEGIDDFINEAIEAKNKWLSKQSDGATTATIIETAINAKDSKVEVI